MLKKFSHIKQLGVFKDFSWDVEVRNKGGAVQTFLDINIIYGRNYSGKTTLSRIVRALETGAISEKYENPSFSLKFHDGKEVTQKNLISHNKTFRVFNEDFSRENLRFINNPDDNIEPFAILGDNNNKIEKEIEELEAELGSSTDGQETGLFAKQKSINEEYNSISLSYHHSYNSLRKQLSDKATNRDIGIKYKPERFGDQNYTITKLDTEIKEVLDQGYTPLTVDQVDQLEKLISEKVLPEIQPPTSPQLNFTALADKTKSLITKKISESGKIEELVKDAILNRWVNEGRIHHRGKDSKCAFCDNEISQERWDKLDKHFDEESEKLEKDITSLIKKIETEQTTTLNSIKIVNSQFYSIFQTRISHLELRLDSAFAGYQKALSELTLQLSNRKNDILNTQAFSLPSDFTAEIFAVFSDYKALCEESNLFGNCLSAEQAIARKKLRLKEISDYLISINFIEQNKSIEELKIKLEAAETQKEKISELIKEKQSAINAKKRQLNDEEKGAQRVNGYLNNFFGHKFLKLEAIKGENSKNIRFEVMRDGKKAYHLSEGERSLLSFCYFLAKLDDIETHNSKPIIWIDDPISSLDSNHIFFIYSLIRNELLAKKKFQQLFIATHNLDFLKYLKRLESKGLGKQYFIVARQGRHSSVQVMPSYMREYVTEFNFLFHQIYKCSAIEIVDDSNHMTSYNFPNNARKFLEIYLYYKNPDQGMTESTLQAFFGEDGVPAILIDRINNEYSHLSGVFERGSMPIEVPEMQLAARLIINKLKQDSAQYHALLKSVGETPDLAPIGSDA